MTQPTVTLPREVVQQTLDALESCVNDGYNDWFDDDKVETANNALRAALDAPAVPTPAMISAGVAAMYAGAWESDAAEVEAVLKAALDAPQAEETDPIGDYADANRPSYAEKFGEPSAPQAVDCRGCAHYSLCKVPGKLIAKDCKGGDQFQALPKIMLYSVPK